MRTAETMFPLVEQWKKSGLSVKSFSLSQGLNNFSFQYWCKKYKTKNSLLKKADARFIPVTIKGPVEANCYLKDYLQSICEFVK